MTTITISGEAHGSADDLVKHEKIYKDADSVFVESLVSEKMTPGEGILFPVYWAGSLLYGLSFQIFNAQRSQYYVPVSEKYGLRIHAAVDKSIEEIYNDSGKGLKIKSFLPALFLLALGSSIAAYAYWTVFYTGVLVLLSLLGVALNKKNAFISALLAFSILGITGMSLFPDLYGQFESAHKSSYALFLLFVIVPYAYFLAISSSDETSRKREEKMAERTDQIIKNKCYQRPVVVCGEAHAQGLKGFFPIGVMKRMW
jgi:hypothetical protein